MILNYTIICGLPTKKTWRWGLIRGWSWVRSPKLHPRIKYLLAQVSNVWRKWSLVWPVGRITCGALAFDVCANGRHRPGNEHYSAQIFVAEVICDKAVGNYLS